MPMRVNASAQATEHPYLTLCEGAAREPLFLPMFLHIGLFHAPA